MHRAAVVWFLFWTASLPAAELAFNFGEFKLNETPPGFRSAVAGEGGAGEWKIILDETPLLLPPISTKAKVAKGRPVLAQLARDRTDEHFPMLIYEGETFGDFVLTTQFKLVEGEKEQMAGIAFRVQDESNYYYVRASALGGTFAFFKVGEGQRGPPFAVSRPIPQGVWHELKLECKGTQIRTFLNGEEAVPTLEDRSFSNGKIAFWTKSDSVCYFADTRVTYVPRQILAQTLVREALEKYPRLKGLKILAASGASDPIVVASSDPAELGRPGSSEDRQVIRHGTAYYGKGNETVVVALPLRDSNGEAVASVRVSMKPFPGQTEKNAIVRAAPIVKAMEKQFRTLQDLLQ